MCTTHRKQMLSAGCASGLCPFSPRFLKEKKEHRKPVRWYTRLIVYGNPGRVVNGYAPGIPVLICGFELVVYVVVCGGDGARPRSSPHPRMRPVRTFLRSYRGTHPLGCSALPCFAAESTREGTLMSLSEGAPARSGSGAESGYPENAAAPAQYPSAERRYRPK